MRHLLVASVLLVVVVGYPGVYWAEAMQFQTRSSQPSADERPAIDLNTAGRTALDSLPGVGPRTAELIIEYRTESGGLKKVEDLMNVKGIGEATFLRIRELVRVGTSERKR
jgi:comEA protein